MQESHHHRSDAVAAAHAVDAQNLKNGHTRSAAEARKKR
jgi:hypothetical protein